MGGENEEKRQNIRVSYVMIPNMAFAKNKNIRTKGLRYLWDLLSLALFILLNYNNRCGGHYESK